MAGASVEPRANRVRELRERVGLSQVELARRARVSARTITNVELGHHLPRPATKARLLLALGLDGSNLDQVFP